MGLLPSCVTYFSDGTRVVGEEASSNRAKRLHAENIVYGKRSHGSRTNFALDKPVPDTKRLLGTKRKTLIEKRILDANDHNSYWTFKIGREEAADDADSKYYLLEEPQIQLTFPATGEEGAERKERLEPWQVLTHILCKAREMANDFLRRLGALDEGEEVQHAVITVPVSYGQVIYPSFSTHTPSTLVSPQRRIDLTMKAATKAGLIPLELVTEPSAAAYEYGFDRNHFHSHSLLVFDFGGGTLDVNVLRVRPLFAGWQCIMVNTHA